MASALLSPLGLGRGLGVAQSRPTCTAARPFQRRSNGLSMRRPLRSGRNCLTPHALFDGRDDGHRQEHIERTPQQLLPVPADELPAKNVLDHARAWAGLPKFGKAMLAGGGGLLASTGFSLDGPWSYVEATGVICFIIFAHECGHFFAARLQNIHVSKFSVGFGPKIAYKGPEVEYSLGLIPLGGFVEFPNGSTEEVPSPYPQDDRDLLNNRPVAQRLIVASAGVIANMVLAFALLTTQVTTVGRTVLDYQPGVSVPVLKAESAAVRAGIQVDGLEVEASKASVNNMVQSIFNSRGETLTFLIERPGVPERLTIAVTPDVTSNGQVRLGVTLQAMSSVRYEVVGSVGEAVQVAAEETVRITGLVLDSFKQLFSTFSESVGQLSGPVAVLAMGAEVARGDPAGLFQFAAAVSINLAVVNILPLPALDGGYIVLLGVEAVRGKRLPQEVEVAIQSSGFLLLTSSALLIFISDTMKLDFVSKLFQ